MLLSYDTVNLMKLKNILAFFVLFGLGLFSAEAQRFRPFTSFQIIQTEHFYIIFPRESEMSARLLATYADRVYQELSALLGIEYPGRIPVTFTPHTDLFNAYYSAAPSSHIVLFDTPMDLEWTTFANNLKGLFIHELAHALTLNSRSPFFRVFHRIFGNWVNPATVNAPLFMVEGVAISLESKPIDGTGFGRANDPRVRQFLRQAIHEGSFLTPFQASGLYDVPTRESFYDYGGLFSAWLINNYGMEKYAELWRAIGGRFYFSFNVYRSGFYRIFRNVYGFDFMDAWKAFKISLTLDGLEENPNEVLPVKYRFFSEKNTFSRGLIARGSYLFFYNTTERRFNIYDTSTGTLRSFNAEFAVDFDVCAGAELLLVSTYDFIGQRAVKTVFEYRIDTGRKTGRSFQGIYRARYFRSGVIGLGSDLHNNYIVYKDFNGNREILLRGHNELMFSGPQPLDDERIVFLAAISGRRELWLYNYVSGELFRIECSINNNADNNADDWQRFARNLRVSDGKLFFSHNFNDRMYKLAFIDFENKQVVLNERDFSGGIFYPASVNGTIYYLGAFTHRSSLLRFPETIASMSGIRSDLTFIQLDVQNYRNVREVYLYSGPARRYFGLRFMNPLQFWFPLPLIRDSGGTFSGVRLDGGGLLSWMADPTDRNLATIEVYADLRYQMAMINELSWATTAFGFPLRLSFSDSVTETRTKPFRTTQSNISGNFIRGTAVRSYGFSLGVGYFRNAVYDGSNRAYDWSVSDSGFWMFSSVFFSRHRTSLQFSGTTVLDSFQPRIDGLFRTNTNTRFPLRFSLFGAYDLRGMDLHGNSITYGSPLITRFSLREYELPENLIFHWLAGAEAAIDLFSFQIQRYLSHVYFNRVFGSLALRNQIYDGGAHPNAVGIEINDLRLIQSLKLRLGLRTSVLPVVKRPVSIEPFVWGAWKFTNTITRQGRPWAAYFGLNLIM